MALTIGAMIRPFLIALALSAAAPALAQADPHAALAAALTSDEYIEHSYSHTIEAVFESALRAEPDLTATEGECPGLFAAMLAAGEPVMRPAYRRDFLAYRAKLAALLGREMSAEHASQGAAFFGSPLGRRFLLSLSENQSVDAQLGAALPGEGQAVTADAFSADRERTVRGGLTALEPLDRREIEHTLSTAPWAESFARLHPTITEYQLEMANADYLPEEDAAMDQAFEAAAETHLAACYGED
jgi:hypothetical protein